MEQEFAAQGGVSSEMLRAYGELVKRDIELRKQAFLNQDDPEFMAMLQASGEVVDRMTEKMFGEFGMSEQEGAQPTPEAAVGVGDAEPKEDGVQQTLDRLKHEYSIAPDKEEYARMAAERLAELVAKGKIDASSDEYKQYKELIDLW